jgi:hypothetical protein
MSRRSDNMSEVIGNFYSDINGYNAEQLNINQSTIKQLTINSGVAEQLTINSGVAEQLTINSGVVGTNVTFNGFKFGIYTATADDQTAGTVGIDTGITVGGFLVQVYRSGILLGSYNVSASGTTITVATNGTDYELTSGDIINWFAFV